MKSVRRLAAIWLLMALIGAHAGHAQDAQATPTAGKPGATITYQLPVTGPLPQVYRVTLAITDAKNPDWIISTFEAGTVRVVTAENGGRFTAVWNGLDDNFMPVAPGTYGVKGIFMPARKWPVTGEYHTLIPKFVLGAGDSWAPDRAHAGKPPWLWGAGFGMMADIAVRPDGKAVFYHNYSEGSGNPLVVDLLKPIGYDQIVTGYQPSGVAGGWAVATDGQATWAVSKGVKEPEFIYRADGGAFGSARARYRANVYLPAGHVTSLAARRDAATGHRFLYVSETGSAEDIVALDGDHATELRKLPLANVRSISLQDDFLYALHEDAGGPWTISRTRLKDGVPSGDWTRLFAISGIADPTDFKLDAHQNFYVSDLTANQVYALDAQGTIVRRFGRATQQAPGHYDHEVFMSPSKLALWTDPAGQDRLLVVERSGPGRVSEWTTAGKLLREWFPGQPHAIYGFAVDSEDPEHLYMATSLPATGSGLIRYKVDYDAGTWTVDAVWPQISADDHFPGGRWLPKIINHGGHKYLAFARDYLDNDRYGYMIYRLDGDQWIPSAGLFRKPPAATKDAAVDPYYWWSDRHGDGQLHEGEYLAASAHVPAQLRWWGDQWLDDLSLALVEQDGDSVWRIAPSGFDDKGNPVFDGSSWQKLLTDKVFAARAGEMPDAVHGGNEIGTTFDTDWAMVDGSMQDGFYVDAYTGDNAGDGIDSTGRRAGQVKISRYVPDGAGGFAMRWRVGRKALGVAEPGEIYGSLRVTPPINHLITVHDGNGLFHVFTDDGLYVDTLMQDDARFNAKEGGVYSLNFELFNGYAYLRKRTGKVYLSAGRIAADIFEVDGWTADRNSVTRLTSLPQSVAISADQIAAVPDAALRLRGGVGAAKVARFRPAGGGPALDGSMTGWEASDNIQFGLDDSHKVEVRTLYDPETIYLRWHVRLPYQFASKPSDPLERIFTDARAADTTSLYIQGDIHAPPAAGGARPGDTRIVFAIVKDGGETKPVALALYPRWSGPGTPAPVSYISPVGSSRFENVAALTAARLGYTIDGDGRGYTIAAAVPRSAIPGLPELSSSAQTTVNFEATLSGKTKFWWANTDRSASTTTSDEPSEAALYPGSWAQAQFYSIEHGLPVESWLVSGPWGGDELRAIREDDKLGLMKFFEAASYPPDHGPIDWQAHYAGPLAQDLKGQPHTVDWAPAHAADDQRLLLAGIGKLFFATSWVYVPADRDIECEFLTAEHNITKVWVDDAPVTARTIGKPPLAFNVPAERTVVHFHRGWNRVFARAYAVGYDLRLGMVLHGDPQTLWQVRFSPSPP